MFTLFLCLSFIGLASALVFVGEDTYDIDSIVGKVTETTSKYETGQRKLLLKVVSDEEDAEINLSVEPSMFCPIGADILVFKKECKLFGATEYEFISCGCQ
ncbi:hypothetical protein E5A76_15855 [Photobacterium sp. CAIM 1937]|nr:hypothetical protein VT25_14485 [Photobacterium leiognathi subsp. mandapamensis]MBP2701329.1 hypothetical protein [Vibrio parahaemolyticus]MZG57909.1 hypothetical protein [Photobacterium lucens]MZG79380.1 hypothetical protein [Photobacterium lucens]PSV21467.1 hypothetical protein C0W44_08820 [Photobacterium leiognathi subsp. mandapamensis]